jgi:nucleosome assembly protein 1-like 1
MRALEAKYAALYAPLYAKRSALVSGAEDVEHPEAEQGEESPAGVPDFWLIALRNHESFGEQITEKDAAVLASLLDVSCAPLPEKDSEGEEQFGFQLTFTFGPNDFFSNTSLTKSYIFSDPEESYLVRSLGTPINWSAGKNVTVKVLKKKGKPGKGGAPAKTLTKLEMEKLQDFMEGDTELGAILRDEIIPNAVSWFTGSAVEEDEEDDEGEEYGDDDDGEEEEEEEEEEEDEPVVKGGKGGKGRGGQPKGGAVGPDGQQECKQQ